MICAIDCDLRMSYCVAEDGWTARSPNPSDHVTAGKAVTDFDTLLFEIASPVSFNRGAAGHAAMTQLAKWAIWNAAWAARIHQLMLDDPMFKGCKFLVAPSNVWTRGYDLKTRHALAKCEQPKKDLRECEAMIWFYRQRPQDWKPLPDYLAAL